MGGGSRAEEEEEEGGKGEGEVAEGKSVERTSGPLAIGGVETGK